MSTTSDSAKQFLRRRTAYKHLELLACDPGQKDEARVVAADLAFDDADPYSPYAPGMPHKDVLIDSAERRKTGNRRPAAM
jgi:hypothetical protein